MFIACSYERLEDWLIPSMCRGQSICYCRLIMQKFCICELFSLVFFQTSIEGLLFSLIRNWTRRSILNKIDEDILEQQAKMWIGFFIQTINQSSSLIYSCKNRSITHIVAVLLFCVAHIIRSNCQIFRVLKCVIQKVVP